MRLHALRLQNFRQHADSAIEFDTGLTGIIGPNGSGKSTILEAVAYALYGVAAARNTKETIRFARAGARASVRVELDFDLAGHRYRVVRGLTSAELYLDGSDAPIANSIRGVDEFLRRRLGMSREEFFNTYFTGQKELSAMAAMNAPERARFLSQVLGYEKLRAAEDLAKERRRDIVNTMNGLRTGMPDPEAVARLLEDTDRRLTLSAAALAAAEQRREECAARLSEIAPRWERAQLERDRFQEIVSELRVAESEAAGVARDRARLERELGDVGVARAELAGVLEALQPYPRIVSELQSLDVLYREEGRRQTLLRSDRELREDIARLRDRRARLETAPALEEEVTLELETKRRELEELQGVLEARRTEWVRDRQEAETKRQALRAQYQELKENRERLVQAGEEGMCPTCNRPLGGHYRGVLDLLDEQVETVRVDGAYYKSRLEQLEEMPEDVKQLDERRRTTFQEVGTLERRLAKVQLAVGELSQVARDLAVREQRHAQLLAELESVPAGYDPARHEFLRQELERLTPLDQRAARLGAQIEREPALAREFAGVRERAAALEARRTGLRQARDAVAFSEEAFAAVRDAHDRAAAEVRVAELAAVAARGEADVARQARDAAEQSQRDVERLQAELEDLKVEKRLNEELVRAYSDIRSDLNQALRPEISALASEFLTDLTDARYSEMELDEQYRIIVLEDGVPKPVISGGEEDIANLVFRLAISQLIAERAGQAFSLLILDEVFGSLDESRRQNVVDLLRKLGDRFEQVIVITHIESVRDGLDRVIAVRYDEESGASRVEHVDITGAPAGASGSAARWTEQAGAAD
ncbi:MAG TPA: SMC family ATPase [Gemmatimonadaceae bacterium]